MMEWLEPVDQLVPEEIKDLVGGHPLVAQELFNRGYRTPSSIKGFLYPEEYQPASPYELPGMRQAIERIQRAINHQETICIWGDFDADGQTATAVLVSCLNDLNAHVIYHVPERSKESHGVNIPVLDRILDGDRKAALGWHEDFDLPSVLITCDTGISSINGLKFATDHGLDVIVSDHHELPEKLPEVDSIINPRLLSPGHPLGTLPGVGVAYKLAEALYQSFGKDGLADRLLDLVAIGIVADIVQLTGDARYLVQIGLETLRTTMRPGLLAILERAELSSTSLNEELISFELAPRLNALGRLGDANQGVRLLTTPDKGLASLIAAQLEIMNSERKLLTNQVTQAALAQIEQNEEILKDVALTLYHPAWPTGILGVVASRLVDRYQKPVVLISTTADGTSKGSARAPAGIHLNNALKTCADLLIDFGGHAGAAGFSIETEKIPAFQKSLNRAITQAGPLKTYPLQIDAFVRLSELNLDLVKDLERLAPFGPGNPAVVLACRNLNLVKVRPVGRDEEHLSLDVQDSDENSQKIIWWQAAGSQLPQGKFDLAFTARATTYRGKEDLQVEWVGSRPAGDALESRTTLHKIEIIDFRQQEHPLPALRSAIEQGGQVWAEGEAAEKLNRLGILSSLRTDLQLDCPLAIWTVPPGPEVLADVLQRIQPPVVYLFGSLPEFRQIDQFMKRLTGMVKYAITTRNGQVSISRLAAVLAQLELTARKGLDLLSARGHITIENDGGDELQLITGGSVDQVRSQKLTLDIQNILIETEYFRTHYLRADPQDLIHNLTADSNKSPSKYSS